MDWTRLFIVLIPQSITILTFSFIAFKLLKRRKDRASVLLSSFYIALVVSFSVNVLFLLLIAIGIEAEGLLILIYYVITYLILLGIVFLVLFLINIYYVDTILNLKITMYILTLYAVFSGLVLCQPNGVIFLENYAIQYILYLLISLYIFIVVAVIIPIIFLSKRIIGKIHHPLLKRKYKFFFIGMILIFIDLYGAILYNTWHYQLYRSIWSGLTSILLIISAILIYNGVGKDLDTVKIK